MAKCRVVLRYGDRGAESASSVLIRGSWDNWQRHKLAKVTKGAISSWEVGKLLPSGHHMYLFEVDGNSSIDSSQPVCSPWFGYLKYNQLYVAEQKMLTLTHDVTGKSTEFAADMFFNYEAILETAQQALAPGEQGSWTLENGAPIGGLEDLLAARKLHWRPETEQRSETKQLLSQGSDVAVPRL